MSQGLRRTETAVTAVSGEAITWTQDVLKSQGRRRAETTVNTDNGEAITWRLDGAAAGLGAVVSKPGVLLL